MPRFVALELLEKVTNQQSYSNLLVNDGIKKHKLDSKDAGLMTEIVYGTISRRLTLEFYLAPFIKKAKKVEAWVKELLLLSIYQMEYLDKVPAYGILNDAVEIAKAKGNPGTGKFVNGVLRTIQRQGVPDFNDISDEVARLSVEISLPLWLTEKLIGQIGLAETRKLGLSVLKPSKASARIDTRFMAISDALDELSAQGIKAHESKVSRFGVVAGKGFLAGTKLFKQGHLTVQDETSMLVAPSMQIKPDHLVLDACAAPGGKTTHIATFLQASQGGKVVALDIHPHKIKLIEENAKRLHVEDVIETKVLDARQVAAVFPDEVFDRVLVDAPCSGLGLLRRKPDIKYHKTEEDFMKLQQIQLEILESIVQKVKVWGIITYSTCTITPEENQEVVRLFLERNPNYELIDIKGVSHLTKSYHDKQLQIYPHQYQTDGFFISCLRRKA
ncbi:16S rRNA (cytosine(967)-C(5))-methyltransferase RsmB [Vagococcus sp.]|uniref:16S rRNA (cytosine(967)-C(5))-methyltransferase RsmB n=1 Tax=Vagococcus sp. TaxID=1933889 RepID=UPI003F9AC12B